MQLAKQEPQMLQKRPSAIATMASRLNVDPSKLLDTLKKTVFSQAKTDEELMALCIVSNEYKLNPLVKEIYAFPAKGGGIVPIVSIDGWIRIINSHPQFDGVEFEWAENEAGEPISCTAIIHRKDRSKPVKVTEFLSECYRGTDPWKMKHRMLRHKALIQGARVAFGFGGIYDEDEAESFTIKPVNAVEISKPTFKEKPVVLTESRKVMNEGQENAFVPVSSSSIEALKAKMVEAKISEADLLKFAQASGEDFQSFGDIDEQYAKALLSQWDVVNNEIERGF